MRWSPAATPGARDLLFYTNRDHGLQVVGAKRGESNPHEKLISPDFESACRRVKSTEHLRKHITWGVTTSFLLLTFLASASAVEWSDCVTKKYASYAEAQIEFQEKFTELIITVAPEYSEVASLYLQDQLNFIDRRVTAVKHLARTRPDQLRVSRPLQSWLDLSQEDEARIALANSRYKELLQLSSEAKKRPPHPNGDALRIVVREKVTPSQESKELLSEFFRAVQALDTQECPDS